MKLSTLLLSSAAVLVAGTAFAADLPSKKAAPASAVMTCKLGDFTGFLLPGSDSCLQISGFGRGQVDFSDPKGDRAKSPTKWTGAARVNFDVRSATELGTLRSFARIEGSNGGPVAAKYGYVQIGGLTAGYTDTAFAGYNGDNTVSLSTDDGAVLGALQYSMAVGGGSSVTLAVEDASSRTQSKDFAGSPITQSGASQIPDVVSAFTTTQGGLTVKLSAAAHQNYGATSAIGSGEGYAAQAYAKYALSSSTTAYLQGAYEKGAISYLGIWAGPDFKATDAGTTQNGWSVVGALAQQFGKGTLNLAGVYSKVTADYLAIKDNKVSGVELNYAYSPVKNLTITPAVVFSNKSDGTTGGKDESSTSGLLRIERDF